MSLTLSELMEFQAKFDKEHQGKMPFYETIDSNNIQGLEHLIVCILGELGEYANLIKKIRRGDFSLDEKKNDLNQELADIFIYVIKLANQLEVDLEGEYLKKMQLNKERFKSYEIP
jgi:NTP pyrophosphatase (non-canonical NTP hydrolase)